MTQPGGSLSEAGERRSRRAALGAVFAAVGASLCCVGPVVAAVVGVGALGALARAMEPWRPYLTIATLVLLGAAFVWAYRPGPMACGPDGRCDDPRSRRRARRWVWGAAVLAAVVWSFPYWFPALAG